MRRDFDINLEKTQTDIKFFIKLIFLLFFFRIVCKVDINAVCSFEQVLFPVFQGILQQDILEFMPYVFQVLSLLLEIRESIGTIPEPYWALFPCLVAPTLWERPGNVTPLIRLIIAYIKLGSPKIAADDKLVNILN